MKNYTIRTKLILLSATILVITLFIGIKGINDLRKIEAGVETMYADRVVPLQQLKRVSDAYAVNVVDISHKTYHNLISWREAKAQLDEAAKIVSENWSAYEQTFIEGQEEVLMNEAIRLRSTSKATYQKLLSIIEGGKSEENQLALEVLIREELYQSIDPYTEKIGELIDIQLEISSEIMDDSERLYESTMLQTIIILIIAVILAMVIAYTIIKSITSQLGGEPVEVEHIAGEIAKGNLSIKVERNRIGAMKSLMTMIENLQSIVSRIRDNASVINAASQQQSNSSQQISSGANEQAASTEEVSSSMEEMAANIQQNTENAIKTREMSQNAALEMAKVSQASEESMKAVQNIYSKINVVVEIAEKTDLLAINAAVEAARAGDEGRGFAVVAAEVRKLAERSQKAANDIVELAENGMKLTEQSTSMLKQIVPDVQNTSDLVNEIATASQEQDTGASQVNNAVQQLGSVTQQNAAAAEEMATSSEEMSMQANELEEITSYFQLSNEMKATKSSKQFSNYSDLQKLKNKASVVQSPSKGMQIDIDEDYSGFESFN
ncbi:methyl-accepting chemotaxis protein [Carboxylicivirga marina]|uniref:methyl-accepting chemotaxis protein n=1 Tax=Carboxylicivirga marina TaxID=2800988 RepID=UPI002595FCAF|nr:methyl-accepting chemotaxis protein [uncultured Carboxylicivirga sp.]